MKMHINVTGRVQGVGFRYTTYQMAVEIGLTGTVKNEDDGSVTIEAVGTKEQITEFLGKVKQPQNPFAKVSHIEQYEDPAIKDYDKFNVVY
ncbi:acylphosphatase [Enterococcus hulanensis]|uniref:acylphosphatase n=1 Tax=Enterococcus hulanensis TaxID=2559929 RepID=A0ABU3EYY0_9ENTE|nr:MULTISPECIES: acylphosphatase [Enterococcus]MBO0412686.1 acylphosphatase [Enterococcus hulanensis]MBO0456959.1 acylphosphatase [Enterococcus hulanensis]MBX8936117.1 acylphosphatase [Enterococcus gilvus]MDT2600086.1 acylphosphatase [Enterococcus hulanensis]MDT2612001.1 acylphosphatase [Enterococcus hulanensis]